MPLYVAGAPVLSEDHVRLSEPPRGRGASRRLIVPPYLCGLDVASLRGVSYCLARHGLDCVVIDVGRGAKLQGEQVSWWSICILDK